VSGHSKWATIKRKKGAADAKRGKIFTRLGKEITIAAREGGGDPEMNPGLRTAVANAKAQNMPNDNIDRAIKRGTGEVEGVIYEQLIYEGYGHGGVAILVETLTDNTNRTAADVRHAFTKFGGKMANSGSVAYLFETMGRIHIDSSATDEDRVMEVVIDAGADDVETEDGVVLVTTPREQFHAVLTALEGAGIANMGAELENIPATTVHVAGGDAIGVMKLINALDDLDDTSKISANFDIDDEEMEKIQDEL
jgi:YebC/PmpR family DNA-binding regulatory protein